MERPLAWGWLHTVRKVIGNRDKWVEFRSLATPNKKMMIEFGLVGFQHEAQHQALNQEVLLLVAISRVLHGCDMCNDPWKLWEKKTFLRNTSSHALLWEEWNCHLLVACVRVCSVMSDSLWPHGLEPDRPFCPWDSPGKNTGVGCHFLLQGIFPTQQLQPESPALWILHHWAPWGANPRQMSLSFLTHSTHV